MQFAFGEGKASPNGKYGLLLNDLYFLFSIITAQVVNTGSIAGGTYILEVMHDNKRLVKKIIIQ